MPLHHNILKRNRIINILLFIFTVLAIVILSSIVIFHKITNKPLEEFDIKLLEEKQYEAIAKKKYSFYSSKISINDVNNYDLTNIEQDCAKSGFPKFCTKHDKTRDNNGISNVSLIKKKLFWVNIDEKSKDKETVLYAEFLKVLDGYVALFNPTVYIKNKDKEFNLSSTRAILKQDTNELLLIDNVVTISVDRVMTSNYALMDLKNSEATMQNQVMINEVGSQISSDYLKLYSNSNEAIFKGNVYGWRIGEEKKSKKGESGSSSHDNAINSEPQI